MKEPSHCTPKISREATAQGETVSIYVDYNHPLLQLKRALPWEALFAVMTRHWRQAGKNTDGRPGLSWDVALYVPLVVVNGGQEPPRARGRRTSPNMWWRACSLGARTPPGCRDGTSAISPGPMLPSAKLRRVSR